ncbi:VOC family protein [Paenisporosarcina indica]|uniref:VOC family protein n=1 Tax=Paenisporosarcina indica TaxID=650093 RepID=UPI000AD2897A|nr:VOC family protein [Paenisporosarcina indica]
MAGSNMMVRGNLKEVGIYMQKIVPNLWFDDKAEEAVNFYVSVFKEAEVKNVARYTEGGMGELGKVMTISFVLNGQNFMAINGGPHFTFTPAVSLSIACETQEEVDHYWNQLSEGGKPGQCGWLEDKYGLSWQVVPTALGRLMQDSDAEKVQRVTKAMLSMKKLDIEQLTQA